MNVEKYEVLGLRDKFPQIEKQVEERPSYDKYAENTDWVSEYVEDTYYRNPSVESVTETETKMLSEISLNKSEVANQEKTQESDSKRKTGKIARIYEAACRTCTFLRVDNDLYIKKNTVTERLNHEKLMGILFEELPGEWLSDIAALSPAKIFTVFCQAPRIPKVTYEELHRQSKGYVALNNGYYEISTGKLLPPETEIFSLDHIDADYDSSAGTPKNYLRFLSSAAGEDQSVGVRIEEVLALMIAPAIKLKQIYVFGTAPGSGKSTIADFADRLHPLGSVTRVPLQDFGANRFSGAGPIRAVMNLSMDISDEPVKEKTAAKLKEITGDLL